MFEGDRFNMNGDILTSYSKSLYDLEKDKELKECLWTDFIIWITEKINEVHVMTGHRLECREKWFTEMEEILDNNIPTE